MVSPWSSSFPQGIHAYPGACRPNGPGTRDAADGGRATGCFKLLRPAGLITPKPESRQEDVMAQTLADVMTRDPATIERTDTAAEAARRTAAADAGNVIVLDNGTVCGILTDRDIAIRLVAREKNPATRVADILSDQDMATVSPDTTLDQAIGLIRQKAVRRLPVVQQGRGVGVVSLGDLAMERDPKPALADVSASPGNA
jgi:CBS domain-containing protein